jgi:hypothetical protein
MDGQVEKWRLTFFMATGSGVPAVVLLTDAILVQSVTTTHASQGDGDAE